MIKCHFKYLQKDVKQLQFSLAACTRNATSYKVLIKQNQIKHLENK